MKLDRYNYNCTWIRGKDHLAADALPRAPVQHATSEDELDEIDDHKHATVSALSATNIDALAEVTTAAANDDDYQHLKSTILAGFPNECANLSPRLRLYWNMYDRLSVDDDFIVCGKHSFPKCIAQNYVGTPEKRTYGKLQDKRICSSSSLVATDRQRH